MYFVWFVRDFSGFLKFILVILWEKNHQNQIWISPNKLRMLMIPFLFLQKKILEKYLFGAKYLQAFRPFRPHRLLLDSKKTDHVKIKVKRSCDYWVKRCLKSMVFTKTCLNLAQSNIEFCIPLKLVSLLAQNLQTCKTWHWNCLKQEFPLKFAKLIDHPFPKFLNLLLYMSKEKNFCEFCESCYSLCKVSKSDLAPNSIIWTKWWQLCLRLLHCCHAIAFSSS